jgi:hypothetical protein
MTLSRKRLQRRIASSCNRAGGRAADIVIRGGLPDGPIPGTRFPIETAFVAKGTSWTVRGNLPELQREDPQAEADAGEGAA